MGRGDQCMPWRRLCFARLRRMNVEFFHARSIRPRDFACSATFGAAPYSTGERKPHIQTLRKTPKFPGNRITYRESLRDIETCLSVQASKLYHMGFSEPVRRSTLADANELRDWRIHAALAQRLIVQARRLYAAEDLGLDLANTVYALDSTTIDLCLSVFPWAHFRSTKSAVKM